jgi:hypothetical protein
MMPFGIGGLDSIPTEYRQYSKIISACNLPPNESGRIGYLSISESNVAAGASQRRGGIHTEGHLVSGWGGGGWGGGAESLPTNPKFGGLYMASTVDNSCRIWDRLVWQPGNMGDCEHLRNELGEGQLMQKNELYWLTDRTPHEALRLDQPVRRQWFRLVTSQVDIWYRQHSTPNRLGVAAACRIIEGSKF